LPFVLIFLVLGASLGAQESGPASRESREVAAARAAVVEADAVFGPGTLKAAGARRTLATALMGDGQVDAAIEADLDALAILIKNEAAKPNHIATTRAELGVLYYRQNRLTEAIAIVRDAIKAADANGVRDRLTAKLFYLAAGIESELGRVEDAEKSLRRALAMLDELGIRDGRDRLRIRQSLGAVLTLAGRYGEARAELEEASRIVANDSSLSSETIALNALGVLEDALGRHGEARARFEKQLELIRLKPAGREAEAALVLGNIARVLSETGDAPGARSCFEQAIATSEALAFSKHLGYLLTELANLELAAGNVEKGRALAARAVATERGRPEVDPVALGRSLQTEAVALHLLGRPADSLPLLDEAVALQRLALGDASRILSSALGTRARVLAALGRKTEARATFHESLVSARNWLASATEALSEPERLAAVGTIRKLMDGWLATALGDSGQVPAIADEVLAWKGQVLRVLSAERAWLRAHADPEAASLSLRLARIVDDLAPERLLGGTSLSALSVNRKASELIAERERIERELGARAARGRTAPPGAGAIAAALGPGEAVVDYFTFNAVDPAAPRSSSARGELLLAIVLVAGKPPAVVDLGDLGAIRDAVTAHVTVVSRLARPDEAALPIAAAAGAAARRAVWDPVAGVVGDATRVFLVPDGFVGALPFETLPGRDPSRYLIEEIEVVYLPLAQERLRPPSPAQGKGALLVGGVAFGAATEGDTEEAREMRRALGLPFEPLPGTVGEVAAIAEALARSGAERSASFRLEGAAATEAAVKEAATGKRFVHLATHGVFVPEARARSSSATRVDFRASTAIDGLTPLTRAAVALAGANERGGRGADDGLLTGAEAAWLNLSGCELVTISGCQSGLGVVRAGESLFGLRRAFYLAGAQATVTALWHVEDEDAAGLMAAFYEALLAKPGGKSAALRGARLAILARNRSRHAGQGLPGTWGAFVLEGDWR
jgi:CHAT domain-containing protein/tetratricopeptide (TPR) repeat protein